MVHGIIIFALIYHGIAVAAYLCLGKFMLTNKIMLMRMVMSPKNSIKSAGSGLGKAVKHVAWCVGLVLLLMLVS